MALTFLSLDDVDAPRVRMDLPPVHLGDILVLEFRLQRTNQGRDEILVVRGEHKVTYRVLDATGIPAQVIRVASTGIAPVWRAVKKKPARRKLGPARFPKTTIS